MITSYVCVDVETTGLSSKNDKLIEIGAVKVADGQIKDEFHSLLQPGRKLPAGIVALTGITDDMLAQAPKAGEVMASFGEFCEDLPLLGHQLIFDFSFLKRAMVNEKLTFDKMGLDTLKISRAYLPELESRSLGYLCRHFAIEHTAHRALGDARATKQLYDILCELFYEKSVAEESKVFFPSRLIYNVKREKPLTIAQKEQIVHYARVLGLKLDQDVEQMTRSEASRFLEKHHLSYKNLE